MHEQNLNVDILTNMDHHHHHHHHHHSITPQYSTSHGNSLHTHSYPAVNEFVSHNVDGLNFHRIDRMVQGDVLFTNSNDNESGRKIKSKEAARMRRNKENDEFKLLSSLLPLQTEITQQLDKASIIRLTISYFKLRNFFDESKISNQITTKSYRNYNFEKCDITQSLHTVTSLDGFLFLLSNDAKFLYVSESVSSILGLSQVVLIGTSIFDYVHDDDKQELASKLGIKNFNYKTYCKSNSVDSLDSFDSKGTKDNENTTKLNFLNDTVKYTMSRDTDEQIIKFTIRFKSVLLKRALPHKFSGWRILQILGKMKNKKNDRNSIAGFYGIALAMAQYLNETSLRNNLFVMTLDSNCLIETFEKCPFIYYLNIEEYVGKSIFYLVHPQDLRNVKKEFVDLKRKEYGLFNYRIANISSNSNLQVYCNCIVMLSPYTKANINEKSPIEDFKIIMINEIYCFDPSQLPKTSTNHENVQYKSSLHRSLRNDFDKIQNSPNLSNMPSDNMKQYLTLDNKLAEQKSHKKRQNTSNTNFNTKNKTAVANKKNKIKTESHKPNVQLNKPLNMNNQLIGFNFVNTNYENTKKTSDFNVTKKNEQNLVNNKSYKHDNFMEDKNLSICNKTNYVVDSYKSTLIDEIVSNPATFTAYEKPLNQYIETTAANFNTLNNDHNKDFHDSKQHYLSSYELSNTNFQNFSRFPGNPSDNNTSSNTCNNDFLLKFESYQSLENQNYTNSNCNNNKTSKYKFEFNNTNNEHNRINGNTYPQYSLTNLSTPIVFSNLKSSSIYPDNSQNKINGLNDI